MRALAPTTVAISLHTPAAFFLGSSVTTYILQHF